MYTKLQLTGHVYNHPERKIHSYTSAPSQMCAIEVFNEIVAFSKSFQLLSCKTT